MGRWGGSTPQATMLLFWYSGIRAPDLARTILVFLGLSTFLECEAISAKTKKALDKPRWAGSLPTKCYTLKVTESLGEGK